MNRGGLVGAILTHMAALGCRWGLSPGPTPSVNTAHNTMTLYAHWQLRAPKGSQGCQF